MENPVWIAFALAFAFGAAAQPCTAPPVPVVTFVPPTPVAVGQTYTVAWQDVLGADADGYYVIERSSAADFSKLIDSQRTTSTSASFLPLSEVDATGIFHRVRAVAGCDDSKVSPNSAVANVKLTTAPQNVVITVQPAPIFVNVGDKASSASGSFIVENIGSASVTLILIGQGLGVQTFHTAIDPSASDPDAPIVLAPGVPKTLKIVIFDNAVSTAAPASYQGYIAVNTAGNTAALTAYAYVNLKVGTGDAATPRFRFKGQASEYAFFDSYSSKLPNAGHPTITVQIQNPGNTPMQIGGEIGPETWLVPKSGWNANPIPAGGSVDVDLSVDRTKSSSPFPRYTYFTLKTKSSQSARLLVQDNDAPVQGTGRTALTGGDRSYTVSRVVSADTSLGHTSSRVRLSNASSEQINADIFFTPSNADGASSSVKKATIVVPPNDVVTLTDPLFEIFSLLNATGQLEVRTTADKISSLTVTAEIYAPSASGGSFGYTVPVLTRGEGATASTPHTIAGVSTSGTLRPSLILAETTGLSFAAGRASLYNSAGTKVGEAAFSVPKNSEVELADLLSAVKGPQSLSGGRLDLTVDSGGGAVGGVMILSDTRQASAAAIVSQPVGVPAKAGKRGVNGASASRIVIVGVGNGSPSTPQTITSTTMVFSAPPSTDAHFALFFTDAIDPSRFLSASLDVPRGQTKEFSNVLEQVFNMAPGTKAQGSVVVDSPNGGTVSARLVTSSGTTSNVTGPALPVVSSNSEAVTSASAGMQRPVFFNGLEQSTDPTRGRRWDVLITEISGGFSTLMVRLYEAGNRTSPIAQKVISMTPNQQRRLSTIFSELGLDSDQRRKDRTNVQVAIVPTTGNGTVVAMALATDNSTGDSAAYLLTPTGGVPATGVARPLAAPSTAVTSRRRAAGH